MPVYYDDKKLIPAPRIGIQKQPQRAGNGDIIGNLFTISIAGTILPDKGSPTSSGTWHTISGYPDDEVIDSDGMLRAILRKQEAIRGLFAVDGKSFEIQPWDGGPSSKCNPRVTSIEFQTGDQIAWFNRCDYNITLEADVMYGPLFPAGEETNYPKVSDVEENWQMEVNEDKMQGLDGKATYRMSHTLSAVGKKFFTTTGSIQKKAWEQARDWVQARLGYNSTVASSSGCLNVPAGYSGFNHVRSETRDEYAGKYAITETWLLSPANYLEEFTVETKASSDDGLTTVSIQGQITGLETRSNTYGLTETKWVAASGQFSTIEANLLTRAQAYGGVTLNTVPASKSVGRNPVNGVITYSVDYNTRPSNCISSAGGYPVKSEVITVMDKHPSDIFAVVPVLGRPAGPVLQDIGTISEKVRTVTIELVVGITGDIGCNFTAGKPDTDSVVSSLRPAGTQVFKNQDEESWTPKGGRYSRTISWTYQ